MVPTIEGEFARKRRMMSHTWPIVVRGGMLSPRGYDPLYAFMIVSHRILRYLSPFLHVIALVDEHRAARAGVGVLVTLAVQLAVLVRAALAGGGAGPAAADRALLRADDGVARGRAVGLARARHGGGVGAGGGDAMSGAGVRAGARPGDRAAPALILTAPRGRRARARDPARVARATRSTRRRASAATGGRSRSTSCARWSAAPSSPAPASRSRRAIDRITRLGDGSCAATRSTSCRTCGTCVRGEMSIVGPRPTLPVQVEQYTERQRGRLAVKPGITGLGAGQRARVAAVARADRARPLVRRAPVAGARSADPRPDRADGADGGDGLYKGERGGWHPPAQRARATTAVLLTGVGKRYDIVSAFAQHATVVAADPNPLAPAQYAAHHRRAVPRIDDPGVRPRAAGAVRRVTASARSCR